LSPAIGILPEEIPGYGCAASTDSNGRYLLYFVDERVYDLEPCGAKPLEISLSLPPGQYSVETLNPRDAKRSTLPRVSSNGKAVPVSLQLHEDIVLLLYRTK